MADDKAVQLQLHHELQESQSAACESIGPLFPRLVRIVRGRGIPFQDAEDVAQEAVADALRQLQKGNFRGQSQIGTWLVQILHGKIKDYWRHKIRGLRSAETEALSDRVGAVAIANQPDYVLIEEVRQALRRLRWQKRVILLLNKSYGWTIEEISVRFGWNSGTVGRQLAEAKREFRELVARR